jgi:hypothetical protein
METVKKTEEKELFTVFKNKNGFEFKVADWNNSQICPQRGIVIIEALKRNQLKQPRITFKKVLDADTGMTYGIPLGIDEKTGELMFQRIILGDVTQFDLANINDRKLWTVISRHESLLGSPFQSGKPLFKKIDKDAEANRIIKTAKARRRASQIAEELKGTELYDMAINLGLNAEQNNLSTLLASVIEKAEKDPESFLNVYDNTNRNVITVFNRARAVGLIKLDVTNGYVWKDTYPLGANDALAIKTIVGNPQLLINMDLESKQRSTFFKTNATPEQMSPIKLNENQTGFANRPEREKDGYLSDKEIDIKLKSLEEKEKSLDVKSRMLDEQLDKASALNNKLESLIDKHENPEEDLSEKTLEDLQTLAFNLGFAPARATTDIEKLIKEIKKRQNKDKK